MRYYRKGTITLSEDDLTTPKELRFEDKERTTIDAVTIIEGGGHTQVVETGTVDWQIPMGKIAQGKWFLLFSDKAFKVKIDGGADITVAASKFCEAWFEFTSLEISNDSGEDMRLTWAIGGE